MSNSLDTKLTAKVFTMAFESSASNRGMFYSDQASTYTSRNYRQLLWRYQMEQSVNRRGNCWIITRCRLIQEYKSRMGTTTGYRPFAETENAVVKYIIEYYSQVRPLSYNCSLTPNESEKSFSVSIKRK